MKEYNNIDDPTHPVHDMGLQMYQIPSDISIPCLTGQYLKGLDPMYAVPELVP